MSKSEQPLSNLADQAYARLGAMILNKQLLSGTFVVEERLAEQLNTSRTPMREAILRLAAEGLLVKNGGRSFSVRSVSAAESFQSLKVREWLEPEAVELAHGKVSTEAIDALSERIKVLANAEMQERRHWEVDEELHMLFADSSGNRVLRNIIKQIRVPTRLFELSNPLHRIKDDGEEHLAILQAFREGDVKGARRAMARHIRRLGENALTKLRGL
jgi:DNA-binding GntR family transcriptional regulator